MTNLAIGKVVAILQTVRQARRATLYFSPKLTIKATRQHKYDRRARSETFVVTIGVPNYAERAWIKEAKKAGEPFPVKRIQLKAWPKKRKAS